MLLQLLSYVGIVLGFVFLTLAIASGLYYVSELVEEHTVPAKRFLTRAIYTIMVVYVLLFLVDGFPLWLTLFSLATYWVYLQNLKKFPFIDLSGPAFIASCVLVIVNHYLWFQYFSTPKPSYGRGSSYQPPKVATFPEVASFFGMLIWFIPFALFVSLSASENVLPHISNDLSVSGGYEDSNGKKKSQGLAKIVIGRLRDMLYKVSRTFGYELDPNYGRII
ncbi:CYFA0S03e02784g1_1 [Cyberlindnera fabianii]|uniref:CYFA0S03e02784g1_1 n=1 Tax=Cyberlindnera fabianii TaxID=36022 RepID=A0A061AVJ2_CYBFA|nr:Protein SVP26 [Cyberlindnera fabianii]CDR39391.1 CYFA0S03e02784g1_1 [Cyberlindnera fabianii]